MSLRGFCFLTASTSQCDGGRQYLATEGNQSYTWLQAQRACKATGGTLPTRVNIASTMASSCLRDFVLLHALVQKQDIRIWTGGCVTGRLECDGWLYSLQSNSIGTFQRGRNIQDSTLVMCEIGECGLLALLSIPQCTEYKMFLTGKLHHFQ